MKGDLAGLRVGAAELVVGQQASCGCQLGPAVLQTLPKWPGSSCASRVFASQTPFAAEVLHANCPEHLQTQGKHVFKRKLGEEEGGGGRGGGGEKRQQTVRTSAAKKEKTLLSFGEEEGEG